MRFDLNIFVNVILINSMSDQFDLKCKEGNDRPSSVIQISLVQNHDKVGKKYYTKDKTNNWETQVCE